MFRFQKLFAILKKVRYIQYFVRSQKRCSNFFVQVSKNISLFSKNVQNFVCVLKICSEFQILFVIFKKCSHFQVCSFFQKIVGFHICSHFSKVVRVFFIICLCFQKIVRRFNKWSAFQLFVQKFQKMFLFLKLFMYSKNLFGVSKFVRVV